MLGIFLLEVIFVKNLVKKIYSFILCIIEIIRLNFCLILKINYLFFVSFKIGFEEFIECAYVVFFGELEVVGNILYDFVY